MKREEFIYKVNEIIDFLVNGTVERNQKYYYGHPCFYLIHTKEEFQKEFNKMIPNKNTFDQYDLYYVLNYMFKYVLNEYDSHTRVYFTEHKKLPMKIRMFNEKPYIVDCIEELNQIKGKEIKRINGIEIEKLLIEAEKMISYASKDYLKIILEDFVFKDANVLMSLPSIGYTDSITIGTSDSEIKLDINHLKKYSDQTKKANYQLDTVDNTVIITYNACNNVEKMKEMIHSLETLTDIDNYIVDLRGNQGGDSSINQYLLDFLKDKNVVTLCDERVFSSARMCLIDLKKAGSYVIGTNPATPISCFGNAVMQIQDQDLLIKGSATYWYYDHDLKLHGFYKADFLKVLRENPNILKNTFFEVDEKIKPTIEDYLCKKDPVLDAAFTYFKKQKNMTMI